MICSALIAILFAAGFIGVLGLHSQKASKPDNRIPVRTSAEIEAMLARYQPQDFGKRDN